MTFLNRFFCKKSTYLHMFLEAILPVIHKVYVCKLLMMFLRNFHMTYILKKALKYKKHIKTFQSLRIMHYWFHLYQTLLNTSKIYTSCRCSFDLHQQQQKANYLFHILWQNLLVVHSQSFLLFNTREINQVFCCLWFYLYLLPLTFFCAYMFCELEFRAQTHSITTQSEIKAKVQKLQNPLQFFCQFIKLFVPGFS